MADEYYNEFRTLLQREIRGGVDKEELVWIVVECIAGVIDGATGTNIAGLSGGGLQSFRNLTTQRNARKIGISPNPWFVFNGQDDQNEAGKTTRNYLRNRNIKGLAGGLFGLAGVGTSQLTQVDVAGIAMHTNAVASTSIHLVKLKAIAEGYKQSRTIASWIDMIMKLKGFKAAIRGSQLAGAAIPVGAVGIVTSIVAAGLRIGIKLTHTKACLITSADLHWRAFQEQKLAGAFGGGSGAGVGPASKILYELFTRRGATRIFGKYDVDQIIQEPSGWMAVNDKIMLM